MIYVITGHLGSGKTLLAVELAFQYLREGRRVASNITLNPEYALSWKSRASPLKLPYIPTVEHFETIGQGYEGDYDENKFGLVLLDEAGTWLNSRDWNDKDRRGLFTWITHARKKGWDVALIVQDYESMDAQIRRSVTELFVSCSRLDRVKIPYLPIRMPRIHMATARYKSEHGPKYKTWQTRGTDLFKAYDTRESVRPETLETENGPQDMRAVYSMLSAWHNHGRYRPAPLPLWAYPVKACLGLIIGTLSFLATIQHAIQTPAKPTRI
ncbi:MAG: zonular occludens toxin domain-containing protein [Pseudomonadota bacterium]